MRTPLISIYLPAILSLIPFLLKVPLLEPKSSSLGTKKFLPWNYRVPPLELKSSKGETVFGTRMYNKISPLKRSLYGRPEKLRCYKTGRSSESVAALSVRTGLTWSPAEKAYEMVNASRRRGERLRRSCSVVSPILIVIRSRLWRRLLNERLSCS